MKNLSDNKYSFPFFGSGSAKYFDCVGIIIRFTDTPTKDQIEKIIQFAPEIIKPTIEQFQGRMIQTGSEQFVNIRIEDKYGSPVDEKIWDELNSEEEEDENFNPYEFLLSKKAAESFEADIEKWLIEVHGICPIEFVYRREDEIEFSDWHEGSLAEVKTLIEKWNKDDYTYNQQDNELFAFQHSITGIFDYWGADLEALTPKLTNTFFPERWLTLLLDKPEPSEAIAYFKIYKNNDKIRSIFKQAITKLDKEENHNKINLITEGLLELPQKDCQIFYGMVGELIWATISEKNVSLNLALIKKLKDDSTFDFMLINSYARKFFSNKERSQQIKAIQLYELALDNEEFHWRIDDDDFFGSTNYLGYCNALFSLISYENGLHVNKHLNEKFINKCLPYGPKNPAIYFNAACLYIEMLDYEKAFHCIEQTSKYQFDEFDEMITQITKTEKSLYEFSKYPPFVDWLKNLRLEK